MKKAWERKKPPRTLKHSAGGSIFLEKNALTCLLFPEHLQVHRFSESRDCRQLGIPKPTPSGQSILPRPSLPNWPGMCAILKERCPTVGSKLLQTVKEMHITPTPTKTPRKRADRERSPRARKRLVSEMKSIIWKTLLYQNKLEVAKNKQGKREQLFRLSWGLLKKVDGHTLSSHGSIQSWNLD